jgi:hypothetical protein
MINEGKEKSALHPMGREFETKVQKAILLTPTVGYYEV